MVDFLRLFLIPLVVTVLGSILYGFLSRRKKEYKITCEQLSLRRYQEKESDDVKISLSYKNEKVEDSLTVMTICLANNGKKDIAFKQVFEDKIQIKLKKAEILDVQIEKQSENVGAQIEKSDLFGWQLSWRILKKNETIVLKIVSVCNEEESNENVKDLAFVFRGNNLNAIEPISSQKERSFIGSFIFTSVILLAVAAVLPLRSSVRYDVVVQGKCLRNASVTYNEYTKMFIIKQFGAPRFRTTDIQNVTVTKQPIISSNVSTLWIFLLAYFLYMIVFFISWNRQKFGSHFRSLYQFIMRE